MANTTGMELKIIEAAIACIEKNGLKEATVRKIAQEANVNVAAINYYFRSKEQLMGRVLEITLDNAFDWSHFKSSETFSPKPRLVAILSHLVEGAQAYPEITRAHFLAPMMERSSSTAAYAKFGEFLQRLYLDLESRGAIADSAQLSMAIIQAVSASILGIGLFYDLYSGLSGLSLQDPSTREQYIVSLVDKLLSTEKSKA